jgi:hypothetical protein
MTFALRGSISDPFFLSLSLGVRAIEPSLRWLSEIEKLNVLPFFKKKEEREMAKEMSLS